MTARELIPIGFALLSRASPRLAGQLAWDFFGRPKRSPRPEEERAFWSTGAPLCFSSGRQARSWGEGPLIVFLHGWESRGSSFFKMIPEVVKAGFKVMAWDGPAHGDSPGRQTNMPDYAFSLVADLTSAGLEPLGFVGHSFGGAAFGAYTARAKAPAILVLISAPSRIPEIFERFSDLIRLTPRAHKELVSVAEKHIGFSINERSLLSLRLDLESQVLCIHDPGDKEIPFADFEVLKEKWRNAKFIATQGLGHRRIVRDPEVAKHVVEFLTANRPH